MDKQSSIVPNVEGFILYLTGALTQHDERNSKKRGYNPYALGHYMKGVNEIASETSSIKHSQEPADLEALKKSISKHFLSSLPPANSTIKAIDAFLATGKAPNYPGTRKRTAAEQVVLRYLEATDPFIPVEEIAPVCSKCAFTLVTQGRSGVRRSELRRMMTAAWESLPKGWTKESLKSMWESLTGSAQHKVTACIKKVEGSGIDDPGAFCASLADQFEKGWRSRPREE